MGFFFGALQNWTHKNNESSSETRHRIIERAVFKKKSAWVETVLKLEMLLIGYSVILKILHCLEIFNATTRQSNGLMYLGLKEQ